MLRDLTVRDQIDGFRHSISWQEEASSRIRICQTRNASASRPGFGPSLKVVENRDSPGVSPRRVMLRDLSMRDQINVFRHQIFWLAEANSPPLDKKCLIFQTWIWSKPESCGKQGLA